VAQNLFINIYLWGSINRLLDELALVNFKGDFYLREIHQSLHMDAVKLLSFYLFIIQNFGRFGLVEKRVLGLSALIYYNALIFPSKQSFIFPINHFHYSLQYIFY
jgi:hypothetical protein